MVRGVFVTGTDTSVGKTIASAALLCRYRSRVPLRYWKPIQTGIEQDDDTAEVRRLSACGEAGVLADGIRLARPLSPHQAAELNGTTIDVDPLLATLRSQPSTDRWVVEGAGGVLVPLNDSTLMIDLMRRLGLPVVIVSPSGLGTINHTLLTLEALRSRSLQVTGVVMVGPPNSPNRLAIERYGAVPVLGELPMLTPLTGEALGRWAMTAFDPECRVMESLR